MTITININDLTLVHKESGGVAKATLPDICLTPTGSGPVPRNYSNTAYSTDIAKGTVTVTADGGNMCAHRGSEFSKSIGDEAGSLGGVISGTNLAEATWLTWSPDVFLEGLNACRLTDKMLMNHGNTACLGGVLNPELQTREYSAELQTLCDMMCDINELPGPKQQLISKYLKALDRAMGFKSTMKAEVPYNMKTLEPYMSNNEPLRATNNWFISGHKRPDVVITNGDVPNTKNIRAVVEMKFKGDELTQAQEKAYTKIAGGKDNFVVLEEGKNCKCDENDDHGLKKRVPEPYLVPEKEWWKDYLPKKISLKTIGLAGAAGVLAIAAVALAICPVDGPVGEYAAGSAASALWGAAFAL